MIAGIFHSGSGLGNQLHRYVATRVLALDKGYDFSMVAPEHFKGASFMNLDMGLPIEHPFHIEVPAGKVVCDLDLPVWEEKTNYYNPEFNFIDDGVVIDGEFQDERYFGHRLSEIGQWLTVKEWKIPNDVCVIGFRGGEFYLFPELGLPVEYFENAMTIMREINPLMRFEVHTDDKGRASDMFARRLRLPVVQDMELNWTAMRYAKHAIIANSSFYILPRLLRHFHTYNMDERITIAPRYWARHNTKEWSMPQNYYKNFKYI